MLEGVVIGAVIVLVWAWLKKPRPNDPKLEAAKADLGNSIDEFLRLKRDFELKFEIAKWRAQITIDDPEDPRSVLPPGHRVIDLASEMASVAKSAGDAKTADRLWDLAGKYDTAHEAQLAAIDRYAKAVDGFLAGAVDAAAAKYLRSQVLEDFKGLLSAYKTFGDAYREALKTHDKALEAKRTG